MQKQFIDSWPFSLPAHQNVRFNIYTIPFLQHPERRRFQGAWNECDGDAVFFNGSDSERDAVESDGAFGGDEAHKIPRDIHL